jgi:glycosyltransferase involved in cell wall biosynthesis
MKTILIAHNYTTNSYSDMSYSLAHHLADNGYNVVFISHNPYFEESFIVNKNIGKIFVYSWSSKKRPTKINDAICFAKIYFKHKPNIVIGHFVGSNFSTILSKIFSFGKVKTFEYYHALYEQIMYDKSISKFKSSFLFFRKKMIYKYFINNLICPSKLANEDLIKYFKLNKGIVILNPLKDRFKEKPISYHYKNEKLITYLGRLDDAKGIEDLVLAYNKYIEKNPNSIVKLRIIGKGNLANFVKENIVINSKIEFIEGISYEEVDHYLSESYFNIIPSKTDNLPTVGIESLMNAVPIIISNSTGLTHYLEDNVNCFKIDSNIDSILKVF